MRTRGSACRSRRRGPRTACALILALAACAGCGAGDEAAGPQGPGAQALAGEPRAEAAEPERPRLILLLSIDTLRADHLTCYGYERATSPVLDLLARESVLFEDASSTAPWTLPAHASLLTGLYPLAHGAATGVSRLRGDVVPLAARLAAAGYATAAVVNADWLGRESFDLLRGFQRSRWVQRDVGDIAPSPLVMETALAWLRGRGERPLFLFLHYFDPHADYASLPAYERLFASPYDGPADGTARQLLRANTADDFVAYCQRAPEERICRGIDASFEKIAFSEADIRHMADLYDAQIRQLDTHLAQLFRFLREEGLMEQTLLVVTSDHGEEFGDHGGSDHMRSQYQELLHVPLLMRGPGMPRGLRVATPVSLVDVAPTLLARARAAPPAPLDGLDLAPLWRGGDAGAFEDRYLYGEAAHGAAPARFVASLRDAVPVVRSVRRGRYKLYSDSRRDSPRLYDLAADPGETRDVSQAEPEVAAELAAQLRARYRSAGAGAEAELSDEDLESLRALGYVQ